GLPQPHTLDRGAPVRAPHLADLLPTHAVADPAPATADDGLCRARGARGRGRALHRHPEPATDAAGDYCTRSCGRAGDADAPAHLAHRGRAADCRQRPKPDPDALAPLWAPAAHGSSPGGPRAGVAPGATAPAGPLLWAVLPRSGFGGRARHRDSRGQSGRALGRLGSRGGSPSRHPVVSRHPDTTLPSFSWPNDHACASARPLGLRERGPVCSGHCDRSDCGGV
ncbi:MAG: hypothetical protein AVDCRST_MAG15-301, partial [uncultured Rubellimicrobium sp.]